MPRIIFRTNNTIQSKVKWKQVKSDSGIQWQSHGGVTDGVCVSMVGKWLQSSILSGGRGVQTYGELGSEHFMAITHSAYMAYGSAADADRKQPFNNSIAMFKVYNLSVKDSIMGTHGLNLATVLDKVSSENGHFALTYIYTKANDNDDVGGHMLGLRHEGEIFQFFDPNYGLIEYDNEQDFRGHIMYIFLSAGNEEKKRATESHSYHYWLLLTINHSPLS